MMGCVVSVDCWLPPVPTDHTKPIADTHDGTYRYGYEPGMWKYALPESRSRYRVLDACHQWPVTRQPIELRSPRNGCY